MEAYTFSINNMIYHLPADFPKFEHEYLEKNNSIVAVYDKDWAMRFLDIGFADQIIPREIKNNESYIKILANEEAKELIRDWQIYAKKHPESIPNYELYKL